MGRPDGGRDQIAGQAALGTAQPGDAQALPVPVPGGQQGKVGQGLARRLVERLLTDARSEGYQAMLLDTFPFLSGAIRLYRTLGLLTGAFVIIFFI